MTSPSPISPVLIDFAIDSSTEVIKIEDEEFSQTNESDDTNESIIYVEVKDPLDTSENIVIHSVNLNHDNCFASGDEVHLVIPRHTQPATYGKRKTYSNKNITTVTIPVNMGAPSLNPQITTSKATNLELSLTANKIPAMKTYGNKGKVRPKDVSPRSTYEMQLPKSSRCSDLTLPPRKKRRLVIDNFKLIPNTEFKQQLQNTSDIVQPKIDLAPSTKKSMHFLTYGGVGRFFAYPGRKILSVPLAKLFFSHLTVTTEIRSVHMVDGQLTQLDPELRTPPTGSSKYEGMVVSYMGPHLYNDSLAKRAANSFDHLIKGMNVCRAKKPKEDGPKTFCREHRKAFNDKSEPVDFIEPLGTSIPIEHSSIVDSSSICLSNLGRAQLKSEIVSQSHDEIDATDIDMSLSTSIGSDNEDMNIKLEMEIKQECSYSAIPPDGFEYEEDSESTVMYTIEESSKPESSFSVSEESDGIFFCSPNEPVDQETTHSNLEMLLAAAEQHHGTLDIAHNIEIAATGESIEVIDESDNNVETKNGVVYCTAESDAEGGLIIIDGAGRRFTVSNPAGLAFWPETK